VSADVLLEIEEQRRRDFRRALVGSLVAHVLFVAALAWTPQPSLHAMPAVVTIDLTAKLPSARPAPAPAAKPAPQPVPKPEAPPPPPPPPVPQKVVLPEKPQPLPEKPRKQEPRPKPRPKPVDYEDALAQLRDELGEQTPTPPEPALGETAEPEAAPQASAEGERVPPEVAAWMKRAEIHVRRSWVTPQEFIDRQLSTRLRVTLSASGDVVGEPVITRSSGDPYYDENVVRAILRASPLPAPPEPGDWPFVFTPRDMR
jgi:TonB family protein